MGSGTRIPKPGGEPDIFTTRPEPEKWYPNLTGTRLLLPEPINSDVFGKTKTPKIRGNPYFFGTQTREMVPDPNPTFAIRTHH